MGTVKIVEVTCSVSPVSVMTTTTQASESKMKANGSVQQSLIHSRNAFLRSTECVRAANAASVVGGCARASDRYSASVASRGSLSNYISNTGATHIYMFFYYRFFKG